MPPACERHGCLSRPNYRLARTTYGRTDVTHGYMTPPETCSCWFTPRRGSASGWRYSRRSSCRSSVSSRCIARRSSARGSPSTLAITFSRDSCLASFSPPPISLAVLAIHHFIPGRVLAAIAAWPIWLKACATMMVGETAYYWAHRLSHQIPFLWRFHAVHHSAEQLDFLVNTRMHPVDLVWSRMIMLTPIFALGLANPLRFGDGLVATTILLVGSMWGYFIHSNIRWRMGAVRMASDDARLSSLASHQRSPPARLQLRLDVSLARQDFRHASPAPGMARALRNRRADARLARRSIHSSARAIAAFALSKGQQGCAVTPSAAAGPSCAPVIPAI